MSFQRANQNPSPSLRVRLVTRPSARKTTSDEEELPEDDPFDYQDATRYVTIEKAAAMTGLSAKAIRRKKEEGVWLEHREWVKGPDDRIYIDLVGYAKWVKKWQ